MDELDLVAALRSDPVPTADVVARHRAQLRRALAADLASAADDGEAAPAAVVGLTSAGLSPAAPHRRRRAPSLAAAAAAAVLVGGLALAAGRAGRPDGHRVTATDDPVTASTSAPTPALVCGSELPIALPVPDGYAGPVAGPSGDAPTAADPDQLVQHWTTATGTIEARWPGRMHDYDPRNLDALGGLVDDGAYQGPGASVILTEPVTVANGRSVHTFEVMSNSIGEGPCGAVELIVAADHPDRARAAASALYWRLFEPGGPFGGEEMPLVTESTTADAPPDIPPCQGAPGVPYFEYVGGPVEGLGTYPTPADALRAFIATRTMTMEDPFGIEYAQTTIADSGYTEITLPDGSIAFANGVETGDLGVTGMTVVHAIPTDGGWTIDRWDATGC